MPLLFSKQNLLSCYNIRALLCRLLSFNFSYQMQKVAAKTRIMMELLQRCYLCLPSIIMCYPGYPIDGNRWSEIQLINRYQSIKLVSWYRLVSANRWPIDNHTKTVHRLLSIGSATLNRRHARYLSDHPPFLGSPGDETGKTNSDPEYYQTPKLKWLIAYYLDGKRNVFLLLLHILFLLDTIGDLIDFLACMYVISLCFKHD